MSKNLNYYKQILKKVSFDVTLFKKELEKAFNYLTPNEQKALRRWVNDFVSDRIELQREIFSI
tara:strand:+ start:150 stop:338 length:189 start_codon:yes stop_codon:yes gene_type:complete